MNYERDYGNRNLLERAAQRVRGWMGHRGGGMEYDDGYRGGMMNRGWDDDRGYREMGDVSGRGGYAGGMDRGYGAANWRGYNDDWNRGMGGGWGRGGEYRTGGYNAGHGAWDVDWDENRPGGYGMNRGGGMNRGWTGGDDRDHYMGRDFQTNQGQYGHDRGWRGDMDDATLPGGDWNRGDANRGGGWNRGEMGGGMMGRGMMGGMNRGTMGGGMDRDWDRYDRDWDRTERGNWNRGMQGGMDRGYAAGGTMGGDADMGDAGGGTIGNYGAYGSYGIDRFRSASAGGVPSGQYFRGYGVGSGYRG